MLQRSYAQACDFTISLLVIKYYKQTYLNIYIYQVSRNIILRHVYPAYVLHATTVSTFEVNFQQNYTAYND